jgi:hypothetical protein
MLAILIVCAAQLSAQQSLKQAEEWYKTAPIAWGQLTEGWQLAIFAEKQSFFIGEPVRVVVVGRNANPARIRLFVGDSPWRVASFTVRHLTDGKRINLRPPRDSSDRMRRNGLGLREVFVQPGGTMRFPTIDLAPMFEFQPGTYVISADRIFPSHLRKADLAVRSNEITISVIAK